MIRTNASRVVSYIRVRPRKTKMRTGFPLFFDFEMLCLHLVSLEQNFVFNTRLFRIISGLGA